MRASAALPLQSISGVSADCSLFGITDGSRPGERQQEAPGRRICTLAAVGECNPTLFLAAFLSALLISFPPAPAAMAQAEQEAAGAWITWDNSVP